MNKINIETKRLELIALNSYYHSLWINDLTKLEKELNIIYDAEPITSIFKTILENQLEIMKKDEERYIWYAFFLIVRKEDRIVVGSIDFKYPPDENKTVEIGYGLGKKYEHYGYMREAVTELVNYAFDSNEVQRVIAETEKDNIASQNVLKSCGFKIYKEEDTNWFEKIINY